ncbi:MAG: NYN domain-containing protein [Isosphaeraceae bacterium]
MSKNERERSLAMFVDLENLAMGFQHSRKTRFEIQKVLERLVEKGKLIVKKAYADWSRYQGYTAPFHEAAIELIEIPKRSQTGKNSADIRLVVDAMDLAWSKPHVDTFVIVSGDSDFSPLVSKLKENGKHVIGLGMKGSTSDLLRDNCDEFIYYEDLERQEQDEQQIVTNLNLQPDLPERKREVYGLLIDACNALRRENHEVLYASMIKDTMKRKKPSFDESYYGYRSFTHLLEEADNNGVVDIERNPKSGTYVVTRMQGEGAPTPKRAAGPRRPRSE